MSFYITFVNVRFHFSVGIELPRDVPNLLIIVALPSQEIKHAKA